MLNLKESNGIKCNMKNICMLSHRFSLKIENRCNLKIMHLCQQTTIAPPPEHEPAQCFTISFGPSTKGGGGCGVPTGSIRLQQLRLWQFFLS